jgi:hydrogenase maturation protein HypF
MVEEIKKDVPVEIISQRFHNTLVTSIFGAVRDIRDQYDINTVALSGGCFQNRYLLEKTVKLLTKQKFHVLVHEKVPANDGGISLGQLAIGASLKKNYRNTGDTKKH